MILTRLIIIIIGIYLAYRFIFDFVLPIYRASKRVHQQFKGMQDQMNQHAAHNTGNRNAYSEKERTTSNGEDKKVHSKDYIDFEEIK